MDTIVCMDGTEVIGAFLAEEFEKEDMASTNRHETIYVVSPEMNRWQGQHKTVLLSAIKVPDPHPHLKNPRKKSQGMPL